MMLHKSQASICTAFVFYATIEKRNPLKTSENTSKVSSSHLAEVDCYFTTDFTFNNTISELIVWTVTCIFIKCFTEVIRLIALNFLHFGIFQKDTKHLRCSTQIF